MQRSTGLRAFVVGLLVLLMTIPAVFVADIIDMRADYNRDTARSVGQEWGGPQTMNGPVLVIPVTEDVTEQVRLPVLDPETGIHQQDVNGNLQFRYRDETRTVAREPLYILPTQFKADMRAETEIRARGIFSVPVYTAEIESTFDFQFDEAGLGLSQAADIHWDAARLVVSVTSNRSLRGTARLTDGEGVVQQIEPREDAQGIEAQIGDPRERGDFRLTLGMFGSDHLHVTPVGRENTITLQSDWPHPSFVGAFLPNAREVSDDGFSATWEIPHLARSVAQVNRADPLNALHHKTAFGVRLYEPNDFYQKSYRAARYAVMFIGLTFLAMFLAERGRTPALHPVQYVFVGVAQLVFFVLMLALAEQIGFALAYAVAAGATILLITGFAMGALRLGRKGIWLGGGLTLLYAVLYLILQSTDYALLAGSLLAFVAVAGTMFATRHETWYGDPDAPGWFRRKPKPA